MHVLQIIRSLAMKTCGENFSHFLMTKKAEGHRLVTNGIYSVLRHPSYFGWFYWSLGTQLVLCNPICTIGYIAAAYHFFSDRIEFEEHVLYDIYGEEYVNLIRRTWIGIPGISSRELLKHHDTSKKTD
jgi:protein-S-isoprenylcysteine O-methyltransferase